MRHTWKPRHSLSVGGIIREWWTCGRCGVHRLRPIGNAGQSSYTYYHDLNQTPDVSSPLGEREIRSCGLGDVAQARIAELEAALARQAVGLAAVQGLIDESHGVYGLHRNDDGAPWDELLAGGRFEGWLLNFSDAIGDSYLAPWRALVEAAVKAAALAKSGIRLSGGPGGYTISEEAFTEALVLGELADAVRACGLGKANEREEG